MAVFLGGSANDVIVAGAEGDVIVAGEGNNAIQAGDGANFVSAGSGNDSVASGAGDDVVAAGEGNNSIAAGEGRNVISAGAGADTILSGGGDDVIAAGEGNNRIAAGDGVNVISAGTGSDSISAGSGGDVIAAGEGNNTVDAGDGANIVASGGGADQITTGSGADIIAAGEGNNRIAAGDGRNIISAGTGNDAITSGSGDDTISAGDGNNTVNAGGGNNLIVAGVGSSTITTLGGNDTVYGGHGNGLLDTGGGSDLVFGGIGNDVFLHRFGANAGATDRYEGSTGRDTLRIEFTQAEWARADVQADMARFLAHLGSGTNQLLASVGVTTPFSFSSMGLTVANIEALEVVVAGVALDPRNDAVTARGDALATSEDGAALGIDLLANDLVPDRVATIDLLTASTLGRAQLSLSLDGAVQGATLDFTPDAAMQSLREGEVRVETLTYRVTDASGDQATASVTITVTGRNDAATISGQSNGAVTEDAAAPATGQLTVQDVDSGEAAFRVPDGTEGVYGTLQFNTVTGVWAYFIDSTRPEVQMLGQNQTATESFTIVSLDGTASRVITVSVTGSNDAPTVSAYSVTVAEDAVATGAVAGLDVDSGDAAGLTYALTGPAPDGLSFAADGSYRFDASGYDGLAQGETLELRVGFVATDAQGATSGEEALAITITGSNDRPVVEDVAISLGENSSSFGLLSGSDADRGETDTLVYAILAPTVPGLVVNPSGSFSFAANSFDRLAQNETFTFSAFYAATDINGLASDAGRLTITVVGSNDAPVVTGPITQSVSEDAGTNAIDALRNASDVDSGALSVVFTTPLPAGVSYDAGSHSFLIDLNAPTYQALNTGQSAVVTVNYGVSDGFDTVQTALVWTVQGVSDLPASPPVVTTGADPLDNDSRGGAASGTLTGNNTAEVIYGGAGSDTISGQGGADTIYGGSGADSIAGGSGGDLIYGGSGNDVVTGDNNADTIQGGYGADTLTGGAGGGVADVFLFRSLADTGDRIVDFAPGTDSIDIGALDSKPGDPAVGTFRFGGTTATPNGLWYLRSGGDTTVYLDTDGDVSTAEMVITLTGTLTLASTDFVL